MKLVRSNFCSGVTVLNIVIFVISGFLLISFLSSSSQQPVATREEIELSIAMMNRERLNQDSPQLVDIVRKHFIHPPSSEPYNLNISQRDATDGQGQLKALAPILQKIDKGYFIECGAFDGEYLSNTLWLEKELGWTGILIEADPDSFHRMMRKNRKAWQISACLSQHVYPAELTFHRHPVYSVLSGLKEKDSQTEAKARNQFGANATVDIQCLPLYTILLALDRTSIDFFSLDIEGSELEVLKTIPFDKVIFKIITIEYTLIPGGASALQRFMLRKGYKLYATVHVDKVYIHSSVWDELVQ